MKKIILLQFCLLMLSCDFLIQDDLSPAGEVSNLIIIGAYESAFISWTNPGDDDFYEVEIYWGTDLTSLEKYSGVIDPKGTIISDLDNNVEYYIKVITLDSAGNKSDGVQQKITPTETLTASLVLSDTYNYGEDIIISLDVNSSSENKYTVSWELDSELDLSEEEDSLNFSIVLKPDITKEYSLKVYISDGIENIVLTKTFTVLQLSLLGTWKAINVTTPIGDKDIVGIWYMDGFELYYMSPNGGTDILPYSAKGTISFPYENEWITLTEKEYWSGDSNLWEPWIQNDGTMFAKYNFVDDKLHMTIKLNLDSPSETDVMIWDFEKIDDTIDPWF